MNASDVPGALIASVRRADRVLILTGAGASAESGVPTFRDKQTGLWEKFDALGLATPEAYRRDPAFCWGWYEWRRAAVLRAKPNAGHQAIAEMADRIPHLTLVTQNVDNLHERAGSPRVIHLHGELAKPYCERCNRPYTHSPGIPDIPEGGSRIEPPTCSSCGGRVRPGVVWFGESLPELQWCAAREAAMNCEIFLSVGTSSVVQPAASLIDLARAAGAVTIEVNPTETDTAVIYPLRGTAGEILPRLVRRAWPLDHATEDHSALEVLAMNRQRDSKETSVGTATEAESTEQLDVENELVELMERQEAQAKTPAEISEEESDAGSHEIVRSLAYLAHSIPPNPNPQTELEAKQERLRQLLTNLTFQPPHKTRQ